MSRVRIDVFGVVLWIIASAVIGLPLYFGFDRPHALLLHAVFIVGWAIWCWISTSFDKVDQALVFLMLSFLLMVGAQIIDKAQAQHHQQQPPPEPIQDVTDDPSSGNFSNVVGIWKTKCPLWVLIRSDGPYLGPDSARKSDEERARPPLPIGTDIRIEQLVEDETPEAGSVYYVTGTITSGAWARYVCHLDPSLFTPNWFVHGKPTTAPADALIKSWAVNPDVLGK